MATWNGARALGRARRRAHRARRAARALRDRRGHPGDDPCAFVLRNVRAPRRWVVGGEGAAPPSGDAVVSVVARVRTYGSLVAFAHTIFALPFAASAVVLVARGPARAADARCAIAAMLVVHGVRAHERDGVQPLGGPRRRRARTRARARGTCPPGRCGPGEALALALVSALAFLAVAATLGFWPAVLAPAVLAVLLGYSYAKRFTWGAHAWLGVALALAPGGAWIAMGARPGAGIVAAHGRPWSRGCSGSTSSTRSRTRTSTAARGCARSRRASGAQRRARDHARARTSSPSSPSPGAVWPCIEGRLTPSRSSAAAALLVYEHSLVRRRGLAAIDKAFFDVNAWVSVLFFLLVAADEILRRR